MQLQGYLNSLSWCFKSTETIRLIIIIIRDRQRRGKRKTIHLSLHCHTFNEQYKMATAPTPQTDVTAEKVT